MPYNTKNRYEQDRLSGKKFICISSVILNWLDMRLRLQRFLKGWMPESYGLEAYQSVD